MSAPSPKPSVVHAAPKVTAPPPGPWDAAALIPLFDMRLPRRGDAAQSMADGWVTGEGGCHYRGRCMPLSRYLSWRRLCFRATRCHQLHPLDGNTVKVMPALMRLHAPWQVVRKETVLVVHKHDGTSSQQAGPRQDPGSAHRPKSP